MSLKVEIRLELCVCKRHVIYHWKSLDEGYDFALDFTSIGGLHKKLRVSKMVGVSILGIVRLPTWES